MNDFYVETLNRLLAQDLLYKEMREVVVSREHSDGQIKINKPCVRKHIVR